MEKKMEDRIVEWAKELQSLAQAGLHYGKDVFDRERYGRIREIAAEMMAYRTDLPLETVVGLFCSDSGYQTPKIDTRTAVFKDDRILLVCERDGRWSLPGGWCEYNLSPAENAVKETREEAGLDVTIERLIAVQDRDKHNQPPYACSVVKCFFLGRATGGSFTANSETTESAYFALSDLPSLAEEKCTAAQIKMCFDAFHSALWTVQFD